MPGNSSAAQESRSPDAEAARDGADPAFEIGDYGGWRKAITGDGNWAVLVPGHDAIDGLELRIYNYDSRPNHPEDDVSWDGYESWIGIGLYKDSTSLYGEETPGAHVLGQDFLPGEDPSDAGPGFLSEFSLVEAKPVDWKPGFRTGLYAEPTEFHREPRSCNVHRHVSGRRRCFVGLCHG